MKVPVFTLHTARPNRVSWGGAATALAASGGSASAAPEGREAGMPQMAFDTFPSQLFWLAVFFLLFYGFSSLVALPRLRRILQARQARISDDLNHATTASETAQRLRDERDSTLAEARDQARAQIAAATDDIRNRAVARDAALGAELAAKIDTAEAAIRAAQAEALASIEEIAAVMVLHTLPRIAAVNGGEDEVRGAVAEAARSQPRLAG